MNNLDLRKEFTSDTGKRFNVEYVAYNDYTDWLEQKLVKLFAIPDIINRKKLLISFIEHIKKHPRIIMFDNDTLVDRFLANL